MAELRSVPPPVVPPATLAELGLRDQGAPGLAAALPPLAGGARGAAVAIAPERHAGTGTGTGKGKALGSDQGLPGIGD
ncbi:hypothetical protein [Sorangium sp. So ce363]|uniref:hypothetical protein n=1 Tax=Sorangium sp. So ce363 TaxID=3133304 RepID=UPI003F5FD484